VKSAGEAMIEPSERRLKVNGLQHRVLIWNDHASPTVVLCHGFLDLAWSFHAVAQVLCAAGLRVVAFDWRGHGETERVGPGGYYHFADYVLDLHELMPLVASGGVHLVGHSMGGTAVALYAGTHPKVPRTLTLIEGLGPPTFAGDPVDKMTAWLESIDRFRRREQVPMRDLSDAVKRLRAQTAELPAELAYFLAEKSTQPAPEGGLLWRFDPLHRTTSPAPFSAEAFLSFLERIEAPTLVVSGSHGFRTEDHGERVKALRSAREIEIAGVGHMIHWLKPNELGRVIVEHVRGR
jgi:pimeloyl-ACP methyl ester carboxylesterase